jgi:predicted dehydrogenase
MKPLGVALYGVNAHQVQARLVGNPRARLVAIAGVPEAELPPELRGDREVRRCAGLDELLRDERVELVSLCSPRRADQGAEAIRCLRAGRHVYAEKPCALREEELDAILAAATASGRNFREMSGTAFAQPYLAVRQVVQEGRIGEVVQVFVQKSYPYFDGRPQDEDVDGGLIAQVGVHGVRLVEHAACGFVESVEAIETGTGNPGRGGLRMAASLQMRLRNGGLATVIANYLNVRPSGVWGYEEFRVFGTRGFVETLEGGARTRLVTVERDWGPLDVSAPAPDDFDRYVAALQGGAPMPLSQEAELHPTRIVLRARQGVQQHTTIGKRDTTA